MAQTGNGLYDMPKPLPLQCTISHNLYHLSLEKVLNVFHGLQKNYERLHPTSQWDEHTFSTFADNTKMNGAVSPLEGSNAIQRDMDKLEKWTRVNLENSTVFNKAKGKVLYMGQGNPQYQYRLRDNVLGSSPVLKDLRLLEDGKMDTTQQYTLSAWKTNLICIKRAMSSRLREGLLSLCSALIRPHLESCIRFWSPQRRKNTGLLEQVQRNDARAGIPLQSGQAEKDGQLGKEKAPGRFYWSFST